LVARAVHASYYDVDTAKHRKEALMSECAKCEIMENKLKDMERMQDGEQKRLTYLIEDFQNATYTTSANFLDVHSDIGWVLRWLSVVTGLTVFGLFL
tara:strand:- start:211 stop:501 length:291 start_codon:yes stop_codon:yes gene_type:complete